MIRCRDIETQLSDYLDHQLSPSDAADVRAHLAECPTCAGLIADLSRITATARQLGPITPPAHLFEMIARQTAVATPAPGSGGGAAPHQAGWRWAAVAATLIAAVSLAWMAGGRAAVGPPAASTPRHSLATVSAGVELAVHHYERAIAELELVTASANGVLEPAVARSVRASLDTLDRAIAESHAALASDPASEPARLSLFEALRRKVDLLQATALIVNDNLEHLPAEAERPAPTRRES